MGKHEIQHSNLMDIRSFVLIVELGNLTKAAEFLQVSRSHVSRQLSHLEKQMGVTLLIRTTRTLRLTDAGKGFYQQCQQALKLIDQATVEAIDDVQEMRGEIKINCVGGYLGEVLIADIVCKFMRKYHQINILLDFSSNRVDLIEDQFDIAFRMGKLDDASFIARTLISLEMATLASPEYFKHMGKPTHPKQLTEHNCLIGSVSKWTFQSTTEQQDQVDVTVTGHLSCKNGHLLVSGALAGNGIIRVPLIYCLKAFEEGLLVQVFDQWWIPNVDFSMIYHKDCFQTRRLRCFIDFVNEYFEALNK